MIGRRRFYRDVVVGPADPGSGFHRVLLDGKPLKTPAGAVLVVPGEALASAIAAEWREQGDEISPGTMVLTKLVNTAIDHVGGRRQRVLDQLVGFASSDVLCYRAEAPVELAQRQAAEWNPLLEWAVKRYRAKFLAGPGINYVRQPPETLEILEREIARLDDFALAGVHAAAALLGSAILALALFEGRISAEQALAAAELDENYQKEKWGPDRDALLTGRQKASELAALVTYFVLFDRASDTFSS